MLLAFSVLISCALLGLGAKGTESSLQKALINGPVLPGVPEAIGNSRCLALQLQARRDDACWPGTDPWALTLFTLFYKFCMSLASYRVFSSFRTYGYRRGCCLWVLLGYFNETEVILQSHDASRWVPMSASVGLWKSWSSFFWKADGRDGDSQHRKSVSSLTRRESISSWSAYWKFVQWWRI